MSAWSSFIDPTGKGYGIGPLPGRKRVALYWRTPQSFAPLAYFTDEKSARAFLTWLENHIDHSERAER